MKRTLFSLILAIGCLSSINAQSRYRGFVEGGASTIVGKYDGLTYQANTSHGLKFGNVFVGVGAALEQYHIDNPYHDPSYLSKEDYLEKMEGLAHIEDGYDDRPYAEYYDTISKALYINIKYFNDDKRISPYMDIKVGMTNMVFRHGTQLGEIGAGGLCKIGEKTGIALTAFYRFHYIGYSDHEPFGGSMDNVGAKLAFKF